MKDHYRLFFSLSLSLPHLHSLGLLAVKRCYGSPPLGALTGALPICLGGKKGVFSKYGLVVEVIAIPPDKFFDLSLIQELKAEARR